MKRFERRSFLRGVLGGAAVAIGLPPLEKFLNVNGTAYAATGASGFPRRFGLFYWGNGHLAERWVPPQVGSGEAHAEGREAVGIGQAKALCCESEQP